MKKYLRVWYLTTSNAVSKDLSNRLGAFLFVLGKASRLLLFGAFLFLLFSNRRTLAGYSLPEAILFFLTFNLIDSLSQLLFRGVYYFRNLVVRGELDYILSRPIRPLFAVLTSHTDVLDFILLWPIAAALVFSFSKIPGLNLLNYFVYLALIFNGLLLAAAFHILILALAITTSEVDNAVMIYRDLSSLGRVPVDLYREPIRFLVTFVLPVGIMVTFPVKALMGLLSLPVILISLVVTAVFFIFSLKVWGRSLRDYSSASS